MLKSKFQAGEDPPRFPRLRAGFQRLELGLWSLALFDLNPKRVGKSPGKQWEKWWVKHAPHRILANGPPNSLRCFLRFFVFGDDATLMILRWGCCTAGWGGIFSVFLHLHLHMAMRLRWWCCAEDGVGWWDGVGCGGILSYMYACTWWWRYVDDATLKTGLGCGGMLMYMYWH